MKLNGKNIICVCLLVFILRFLSELWAILIYTILYTQDLLKKVSLPRTGTETKKTCSLTGTLQILRTEPELKPLF